MQGTPLTTVTGMLLVCLTLVGLPQPAARAVVDTTPPTGTIIINNNRSATNTPNVMLVLTWDDGIDGSGVSRMRFSNDGATWSAWEALAETRAYTLPSGEGHKTVRVQYLDRANNRSAIYNDYIRLDTTSPTGSIIINNGDASTMTRSVTLGLTWTDGTGVGVTRMRFSDNGSTWTAWETPTATRPHTLPAGLGYHTVRVQYLDGANNYSLVCNDYIKLVEPAPGSTQTVLLPGDVPLVMVWIPSGSFMMGRYPGELLSSTSEDPQHLVTLTGFWMGKYELTKRQWIAVMGTTPWFGKNYTISDLDSPAVWVSWDDAQAFMVVLNALTGKTFHLPSESQWEYACRAGTATLFYWSDNGSTDLVSEYAWWTGNCLLQTSWYAHVVGLKLPNSLGLYDMSGNVWECCEDYYHDSYVNAPTDGSAWVVSPIYSKARIGRGGSYNVRGSSFSCIRSAARNTGGGTGPDYGFRVARS